MVIITQNKAVVKTKLSSKSIFFYK
jgi:hypothetical protein